MAATDLYQQFLSEHPELEPQIHLYMLSVALYHMEGLSLTDAHKQGLPCKGCSKCYEALKNFANTRSIEIDWFTKELKPSTTSNHPDN